MPRKPAPEPLTLGVAAQSEEVPTADETHPISTTTPPSDSRSPRSPISPFRFAAKKSQTPGSTQPLQSNEGSRQRDQPHQQQQQQQQLSQEAPTFSSTTLTTTDLPPAAEPQSGLDTPTAPHRIRQNHSHRQDDEKTSKSGFFFNLAKSSRSSDRLQTYQYPDSRITNMSRGSNPTARQASKEQDPGHKDRTLQKPMSSLPSKSDLSLASSDHELTPTSSSTKRSKPKPFQLLSRTRSLKDKDKDKDKESPSPKDSAAVQVVSVAEPEVVYTGAPLRTAPVNQPDRSFREMMSSATRNHSAERSQPRDFPSGRERTVDRDHRSHPSSFKENGGHFLSGLKSSSSRAADMISGRLFGKSARSGSTTEREPGIDDEHYVLKIINRPLVEQTRLTRISKRLEVSRDRTEFWMPAFPWRAIDYLNYKGCDVEGLYRVPGSGPQIKKWQRKFDEEGDVDLFAQKDLYDINIIGSMLKAWLRELPDELFPKDAQDRIARQCTATDKVPQLLIDELSNLSPFNYYLLFAITCHLSLLLAHSDKNKMDFRNLCICFQPCMKIDAYCFKFLVCDWRDCWKGCKNEEKYIEEEYALFDLPPPHASDESRQPEDALGIGGGEDRNVSSSDSSKQSNYGTDGQQKGRLKKKAPPVENGSVASNSTISTTLTINSDREVPPRKSGDLRPLSPIKPLSPLGF